MKLLTNSFRNFSRHQGDLLKIGDSSLSKYCPAHVLLYPKIASYTPNSNILSDNLDVNFGVEINDKLLYTKTKLEKYNYFNTSRGFKEVLHYFRDYNGCAVYQFKYQGEPLQVYLGGGWMFDDQNNFLVVLTVKTSELEHLRNDPDYGIKLLEKEQNHSSFKIFISSDFYLNPRYKNFYNRLEKEFFKPFIDLKGSIEILDSEEIDNILFKNTVENLFKFESITEMDNFLENTPVGLKLLPLRHHTVEELPF